jgi:hypothetical protein
LVQPLREAQAAIEQVFTAGVEDHRHACEQPGTSFTSVRGHHLHFSERKEAPVTCPARSSSRPRSVV